MTENESKRKAGRNCGGTARGQDRGYTGRNRIDTNLLTANCVSLRQEVLNLTVSGALDQQYVHGVLAE